jgi:hypothetical protein
MLPFILQNFSQFKTISFDFNSIFWLISGIFLSIFVSIAVDLIKKYINRPILSFKEKNNIINKTYNTGYIFIKNRGRNVAKGCSANLTIENIEAESVVSASLEDVNEPMKTYPEGDQLNANLPWASVDRTSNKNLNRGETAMLYLFKTGENNIIIPSELGWKTPTCVLSLTDAPYEGTLRITSQDSTHIEKDIIIGEG